MNFSTIFLIQIIITVSFCVLASICDIRNNYVPEKLTYVLLFFGLVSNLILSIFSNNIKFILASFISMFITYVITYLLWKLKMWGGGDVMLFTAIATVIPNGLNIDFLNIFPQLSVYPFAFSVVVNSILVSFPFLMVFFIHLLIKNEIFKGHPTYWISLLNIENLRNLIHNTLNKTIPIKDLKEGNIVNDYYFDNEYINELIKENDGNLEVFECKDEKGKYYFKSMSAGGITRKDMYLIKILSAQEFIGKDISIKITYPFTPAIFAGLLIAVFYGDIMMLFTKNLVLVI
ncbi:MAG: prepilin peptidase [Methanobrevibacter sp.]|uniref:prepilin peptidase n=1 Tax=Methanobrevibacter sp. TaxID=66852 RepID=UPI0025E60A59|nr:A24 family peptidase [Methanobrevibacter sp.]MBQ8017403.1 prepilin peptidase [Methanobrevibacter sp.]